MIRALVLLLLVSPASWAGSDLPVSCETVRQMAPVLRLASAKAQRDLIRKYHVTRKMIRQARACLR